MTDFEDDDDELSPFGFELDDEDEDKYSFDMTEEEEAAFLEGTGFDTMEAFIAEIKRTEREVLDLLRKNKTCARIALISLCEVVAQLLSATTTEDHALNILDGIKMRVSEVHQLMQRVSTAIH